MHASYLSERDDVQENPYLEVHHSWFDMSCIQVEIIERVFSLHSLAFLETN